jgi:hypothetical protein
MAFGKAALCIALTTAALTCCSYVLAQGEPSDPGDSPATSEGPIEAGKLVSGIIDVSGFFPRRAAFALASAQATVVPHVLAANSTSSGSPLVSPSSGSSTTASRRVYLAPLHWT